MTETIIRTKDREDMSGPDESKGTPALLEARAPGLARLGGVILMLAGILYYVMTTIRVRPRRTIFRGLCARVQPLGDSSSGRSTSFVVDKQTLSPFYQGRVMTARKAFGLNRHGVGSWHSRRSRGKRQIQDLQRRGSQIEGDVQTR